MTKKMTTHMTIDFWKGIDTYKQLHLGGILHEIQIDLYFTSKHFVFACRLHELKRDCGECFH